jgi:hypothetical protein
MSRGPALVIALPRERSSGRRLAEECFGDRTIARGWKRSSDRLLGSIDLRESDDRQLRGLMTKLDDQLAQRPTTNAGQEPENRLLAGTSPVEPTGIEPVTSCLQTLWLPRSAVAVRLRLGMQGPKPRSSDGCWACASVVFALFGTHRWYPLPRVDRRSRSNRGEIPRFAAASAVPPAGFEPAISCVKGRRPNR